MTKWLIQKALYGVVLATMLVLGGYRLFLFEGELTTGNVYSFVAYSIVTIGIAFGITKTFRRKETEIGSGFYASLFFLLMWVFDFHQVIRFDFTLETNVIITTGLITSIVVSYLLFKQKMPKEEAITSS